MSENIGRPDAGEHAGEFDEAIQRVAGDDILTQLDQQLENHLEVLRTRYV